MALAVTVYDAMARTPVVQWAVAAAVAIAIARRGLRKRSLAVSGAAAAFIVGTVTLGASAVFGLTLLAFYFTGSAFTKRGGAAKELYDAERRLGEGERDWRQVVATAGFGAALAAAHVAMAAATTATAALVVAAPGGASPQPPRAATVFLARPVAGVVDAQTAILVAYVATFAMVTGDTWASELGILSPSPPVQLWRAVRRCGRDARVPRGANGGVSAWGTLVSLVGGAFIGALAWMVVVCGEVLRAAASDSGVLAALWYGPTAGTTSQTHQGWLVVVGAVAGESRCQRVRPVCACVCARTVASLWAHYVMARTRRLR